MLIGLKPSHRLSDIMREVKHESSRWIHKSLRNPGFEWQKGYSAFTVSPLACEKVKRYIAGQSSITATDDLASLRDAAGIETVAHGTHATPAPRRGARRADR
jgi:hypothetical protein